MIMASHEPLFVNNISIKFMTMRWDTGKQYVFLFSCQQLLASTQVLYSLEMMRIIIVVVSTIGFHRKMLLIFY